MKFGEKLRILRYRTGLNQKRFAEKIKSTRSNIGAYEEGRAYPPPPIMKIIVSFYDIPDECLYDFLFTEKPINF